MAVTLMMAIGGCGFPDLIDNGQPAANPETPARPDRDADHETTATVVGDYRVIDGDSVELADNGSTVEVRLENYNAPELRGDGNEATCQGSAARDALEDFLASGRSELVPSGVDRFGRTLGALVVGENSAVDVLVAAGEGLATGDDENRRALMVEAATAGVGIWGDRCGAPISTDLVIDEVRADAEGDDRFNLNDEWVRLRNRGRDRLDLTGWVLRDDTFGHRFGLAGTLEPDATLTVRSGTATGTTATGDYHLGERFPVWSNRFETVIVVDPAGVFADWRFVDGGSG